MTLRFALIITAVLLFILAAILAFSWFKTNSTLRNAIGFVALGLAALAAAFAAPPSAP